MKQIVIRDPIHGYIHLTDLERRVLSHRIAQRLRQVQQNGLAHLVYPEARTSRFSHSLGAMHLASICLASCLNNATTRVRRRFIRDAKRIVSRALGRVSHLDFCKPLQSPALRFPMVAAQDTEDGIALATIEQALRLGALFHDLGHLPYSHDFEEALQFYWRTLTDTERRRIGLKWLFKTHLAAPQPHEQIGHKLAHLVLNDLYGDRPAEHFRIAFELGIKILDASPPLLLRPTRLVEWLKSLIDGELDVDRADYLQRDARAFGFEFAGFDSQRLFENVVLVYDKHSGYEMVVRDKALTALESFYMARTRSHQHLVRHHKVAQAGCALTFATASVLKESALSEQFLKDLAKLASFKSNRKECSDLLKRFACYDDAWWRRVLQDFYERQNPQRLLAACLGLVLWREEGLKSLWKRVGDFPKPGPKAFNARFLKQSARVRRQRALLMQRNNLLIRPHRFSPTGKRPIRVQVGDEIRDLFAISSTVDGLRAVVENDVLVHAFAESGASINRHHVLDSLVGSNSWRSQSRSAHRALTKRKK